MRINFLELKNYRKFEYVQLELPDGIIGILGKNGAGKSTLVESIAWALFGNQKEIVRLGKDSVRRDNAPLKDPTSVKVEFRFAEDEYILTREMSGKSLSMNARLIVNGKIVANGATDVTNFVEKKLGMDYKSFFISVFARQKELNALSSLTERERRITVVRMLGIDRLDDIIDNISKSEKTDNLRAKDLEQMLTDEDGRNKEDNLKKRAEESRQKKIEISMELSKLREEQGKLEKSEKELTRNQTKVSGRLTALREAENRQKMDISTLDSRKRELDQVSQDLQEAREASEQIRELDRLDKEVEELRIERDRQKSLEADYVKLTEKKEELKSIQDEMALQETEISRLSDITERIVDLKNKLDETKEMTQVTEKELLFQRENHAKTTEQIRNLEEKIEHEESHLDQIEELGPSSKCPTCERLLGDHYEELREKLAFGVEKVQKIIEEQKESLSDMDSMITDRTNKLDALNKREESIRKEENRLAQELKSLEIAKNMREKFEKQQNKLIKEISRLEAVQFDSDEARSISERLDKSQEKREKLIGLKRIAEKAPKLEKSLSALESEIKEIETRIEETRIDTGEIDKLEKSKEDIEQLLISMREREKELYESIVSSASEEKKMSVEIDARDKEVESLGKISVQLTEIRESGSRTGRLLQIIKEFRKDLLSRIIPTLSQVASDLIVHLTNGRYPSMSLDENYNIYIEDSGENHRLERFSGGENDLANLCLRLAISKVISERAGTEGMNMLVLDEIFGSQDSTRKRNLLTAFNILARQFRQIFLITHIEDIKDSLSEIMEVYEDDRGVSHVRTMIN